MKINVNQLPVTRKSCLLICFFACMFVFASFTREDRQRVREFKKEVMSKLTYKKVNLDHQVSENDASIQNQSEKDFIKSDLLSKNSLFTDSGNKETEISESTNIPVENSDNFYLSKEKEGIIGAFSDQEEDQISDNFFTIDIPVRNTENSVAYLEYDLFGLASHESVSRSINHNIAIGGGVIVSSAKWSHQREAINAELITTGSNTVLFTSPAAGVKYKVKNLKLVFEKNKKPDSYSNISSVLSDDQLYIKGNTKASSVIMVNNESVAVKKGEFEKVVRLSDKNKKEGLFTITNGTSNITYKIPASTNSFKVVDHSYAMTKGIQILKDKEFNISYENMNVSIEKGTSESAYIEILKLREKDIPAVSQGLKNVTLNNGAYRFSVVSGTLEKKAKITIPYDTKRLGMFSAKEIKVFHFDYAKKQWVADKSVVDEKNKTVTVEGNGDNDYINGIISTPESPQTNAFSPTSISELKAADPMDGMQLMAAPTASQKGDANMNYPINVPSGLGGLQPSLSIGYNSGGGNGWMGEGWDMQGLSSITVDTRWGVPLFDSSSESELYTLDGEMLVYPNGYLPHRHNNTSETSTDITTERQARGSGSKQFYLRKNHDFTLIQRNGSGPGDYSWTITSTNGTKSYYGGSTDSVIKDSNGKIVHWGLRMVVDVHGNTMSFSYQNTTVSQGASNISGGTYFHIKKITYGKNQDYAVTFNTENGISRKDININAKQGVKRVEPYLLNNVAVSHKTKTIRTYHLEYEEGQFSKTRLKRLYIVVPEFKSGLPLPVVDDYNFDYYNEVENNKIFGPDTQIQVNNTENTYGSLIGNLLKPSKINGNISTEKGLNVRAAAGLNFFTPSNDAYGHLMFGFPFGFSSSEAKNAQQLIDFNGDGIQDMIYRVPDKGLRFSKGVLSPSGLLSFEPATDILNYNSNFSYTETKTNNSGWDMGAIVYSKSETSSSSKGTTSTYLVDANSDGLVDIVNNGEVWFNRYNQGQNKPEMTKHSEYTENMVVKAKAIVPPVVAPTVDPKVPPIIAPEYPPVPITDVVKVWIASRDGYITFKDNISVYNLNPAVETAKKLYYSVEIKNPNYIPGSNQANNFFNGRIYLKQLETNGNSYESISISKYNDYYAQFQNINTPAPNDNRTAGINSSNRLFVKSGEKVYVRLHKGTDKDIIIYSNPVITYIDPATGNELSNTNELSQGQFQLNNGSYENNFFLNNFSSPIYLDATGTAKISIASKYFAYTTDKIRFKVIKENALTGQTTILHSQEYAQSDTPFYIQAYNHDLAVDASEPVYLKFVVESDSHTSFFENNWNSAIVVNYNAIPTGSSNNVNVKFYPSSQYPSFAVTKFSEKIDIKNPLVNPNIISGQNNYSIQINKNITNLSSLGTGNFYYVVKKGNTVLAKRKVNVVVQGNSQMLLEEDMQTGQQIPGLSPIPFYTGDLGAISADKSHLINIQVYCQTGGDFNLFNKYSEHFQGKPFDIYYGANTLLTRVNATSVNTAMYNTKSAIYNNWGQFIYKPGSFYDYSFGTPILEEAFTDNVEMQNTYPQCQQQPPLSNEALAECIFQNSVNNNPNTGNNTISQLIAPMKPITELVSVGIGLRPRGKWLGNGPKQYITNIASENDETVNYFADPVPDPPVVAPVTFTSGQLSVDTTMKAISKKQSSRSRNKTKGFSIMSSNIGNSETYLLGNGSIETQTFSDLNGDGYPDMVYPESVQFTNSTGSLEDISILVSGFPTSSSSYQKMNSVGLSYNAFSVSGRIDVNGSSSTTTKGDTSMPWTAGGSVGGGVNNYYDSSDYGTGYWLDLNGDGLPDRINYNEFKLNLGKSLSAGSSFENLITYKSHPIGSQSISIGTNLGAFADLGALSSFGFGISASLGGSASKGSADVVHEDINSDGLVDIVEITDQNNVKSATVRYNLGNKFATAVPLMKSAGNVDFTEESGSYNGFFSFGGHFMFNIGPITLVPPLPAIILFIKAGAGATANLGINVSETKKAFKDMNGDGFVDLVVDTHNGFTVNYSLIGKTNKLKTITHALTQGKYTLDYQFTQPNYQNPHAKLVVKEIRILNPDVFSTDYTKSNGDKDVVTRYKFENSKYDRRERENFGFEKVTREDISAGGNVYRKTLDTYYNTSYFLNSLLKNSQIQSETGTVVSNANYNYKVYKFKNNSTEIDLTPVPDSYDTGGTEGRKMGIVLLNMKTNSKYAGSGQIKTAENMTYNKLGQVIRYQYSSPTRTYNSVIDYWTNLSNNMINVPKQIDVYDGTGTSNLIRRRKALDPNILTGKIGKYAVYDGFQDVETEFTYEPSGNIKTVKYPPNENGQRNLITYEYDNNETGKYVTSVSDISGYTSTATYYPFFDKVEKSTDVTGNSIYYSYDEYGRVTSVKGPNEPINSEPAIQNTYYNNHYGIPSSDQNIKIFRAQTSHLDIENPSNRINTDTYSDFMGRVIQVKKDIEVDGIEKRSVSGRPVFDVFGRSVQQFHPMQENQLNNNLYLGQSQYSRTTEYDILDRVIMEKDEKGNKKSIYFGIEGDFFKATEEFYNMKSETFTNAEGKVADKNDYLYNNPLNTHFEYNTAGDLISVTDPEGIQTVYAYDLTGRRLSALHPDKGMTKYEYDTAGNLIRLLTANLANDPVDNIYYKYDYNRLTDIIFPNLQSGALNSNNVHYEYMPANSGNNTGRIIRKTDGTGYTTYNYGKLGEVTSETRRVYGYNVQTMEFKTDYIYDSWNRIKQITYPDNEQVFYSYDLGGNLKSVRNGSYQYIKNIKYDFYEQRTNIVYGNDTESSFNYDFKDRKLVFASLKTPPSNYILSNSYKYDPAGNITDLFNGANVSPNGMGGTYSLHYEYDTLNRLIGTEGSQQLVDKGGAPITPVPSPYPNSNANFKLKMEYNKSSGIASKNQEHKIDLQINDINTYENNYKYIDGTHKVAVIHDNLSSFTHKFDYDNNGNVTVHKDLYGVKRMFWDEQDRMKAFYNEDSGVYQYYAYDDKGERTIKYDMAAGSQLYQNGELVDPGSIVLNSYKLYPSPYVVVTSDGQYTKHYFEGSTRFASRIQDGADMFISYTARTADSNNGTKEPDPSVDFKAYLEKAGIEGTISSELVARGPGGPGGQPGLYYLHGDHLGSATYVTDYNGKTTQFFLNLPFGESMIEQSAGIFDNPYKFNAKEQDKETGLYYYGARYYNPQLSIWYGVDPLAEKMPSWSPYAYTFNNPVKFTDPTGMIPENIQSPWGKYYDSLTGKLVYDDGKNDGKVYIRSTVQLGYNTSKIVDTYIGQENQIPDKTRDFKLQLAKTNAYFSQYKKDFENKYEGTFGGYAPKFKDKLETFASKVGNNKPFDLKRNINTPFYTGKYEDGRKNENFFNNYAFFDGQLLRSDDFGNFNYGVAGKAFGLSNIVLEAAAGINQIGNGFRFGSPIGGLPSYGDDPKDNETVRQGINYHNINFKK